MIRDLFLIACGIGTLVFIWSAVTLYKESVDDER